MVCQRFDNCWIQDNLESRQSTSSPSHHNHHHVLIILYRPPIIQIGNILHIRQKHFLSLESNTIIFLGMDHGVGGWGLCDIFVSDELAIHEVHTFGTYGHCDTTIDIGLHGMTSGFQMVQGSWPTIHYASVRWMMEHVISMYYVTNVITKQMFHSMEITKQ